MKMKEIKPRRARVPNFPWIRYDQRHQNFLTFKTENSRLIKT